jgi:hypothetical protein
MGGSDNNLKLKKTALYKNSEEIKLEDIALNPSSS